LTAFTISKNIVT